MIDFHIGIFDNNIRVIRVPGTEAEFTESYVIVRDKNEVVATFRRDIVAYIIRH